MALPLTASLAPSTITRVARFFMIPSHFLLQQLDYLAFIDIYHERISAPFTSRTPNLTQPAAKVFILATPTGLIVRLAFAPLATARWILRVSFPSLHAVWV